MKKKLSVFLLVLLMALMSLTACGGADEDFADEELTSGSISTLNDGKQHDQVTSDKEDDAKAEKKETDKNSPSQQADSNPNVEQVTNLSGSSSGSSSSAKNARYCYVTVEGYCTDKEIKLKSGDTAYSVLKKTDAVVSARNTGFGVYVAGINGRFEFDEGDTSGWMYSVNGVAPNRSAGEYKISEGDNVKWYYVTDYQRK